MPWTGVRDLGQDRRIVAAADRPNAGLLVDAFHFDRSGSRLDALAEVPRHWLRYVQLCDVAGPCPDDMAAIIHEARQARCFPGEGDIDLVGLLAVLPEGVPLSLEIPTQALRDRGVSALDWRWRPAGAGLPTRHETGFTATPCAVSSLTDEEWRFVAGLFEERGGARDAASLPPTSVGRCVLLYGSQWLLVTHVAPGLLALAEHLVDVPSREPTRQVRTDA